MAKKRFVFKPQTASSVKKRANQSGGGFDSYLTDEIPKFKSKDGENAIRILPAYMAWIDDKKLVKRWGDSWGIEIWVHYSVGPDNSSYLCPKKMLDEDCPICDARVGLDAEAAKKMAPGKRVLAYLIDRNNPKDGPLLWAMPAFKVEKEIASRSTHKKTGDVIQITDPEEGFDVTFTKEGKEDRTNYTAVDIDRESSPLANKETTVDKWLDFIMEHPLHETLKYFDGDYLENIYMGKGKKKKKKDEEEEDDIDEEDDDEPKRKSKSKARRDDDDDDDDEPRKKSKSRRDEDEEEDEEEDDDDRKSSKSKRRSSSRDDDGDGEDEEDEEEDSKGSRSRGSSRRSRDKEDEDEEEDEDSEEEEDRPSKKDRSKAARKSIDKLKKKRRDEDEEDDD